jgi:hypothetical protein
MNAYIDEVLPRIGPGEEPEWGELDCATFVAGAVEAITGDDPMEGWPSYSTRREALETLREQGAGDLASTLEETFGKPVHPARARRGDIAWSGSNCGLVIGRRSLFLGDGGYSIVRTLDLEHAYPVGR